jgi:integrase
MPTKIDEHAVRTTAAPAKGSVTVWDNEIDGFLLRVYAPTRRNPKGARGFAFNYRVGGVERRIKIGKHPAWSALAARHEAKALRQQVDRGEDPALEKREAPTVADLAERYRAEHLSKKAERSQVNNWAMIVNDILPELGQRKVADINQGDMTALHRKITDSDRPVRANRVLAVMSKMFSLSLKPAAGEARPWRDAAQGNPVRGVERNQEQGRERFFDADELAAIRAALDAYELAPAADCLRLIMWSGCRPGEALHAQWSEFAEPGIWTKPSAATKQRRVHRAPLSPDAVELVERLRLKRERNAEYVFPWGAANRGRKEINKAWAFVRDRVGLEPGARPYDLRHSYGSAGAHAGLSEWTLGKLLGHSSAKTTEKYLHAADAPLRAAAAKIGRAIAGEGRPRDRRRRQEQRLRLGARSGK